MKCIPRRRIASIDTARGATVGLMIFVNHAGQQPAWILHAAWDGLHLADVVMPSFLLLMGASTALSLSAAQQKGVPRGALMRKTLIRAGVPFASPLHACRVHAMPPRMTCSAPTEAARKPNLYIPQVLPKMSSMVCCCARRQDGAAGAAHPGRRCNRQLPCLGPVAAALFGVRWLFDAHALLHA